MTWVTVEDTTVTRGLVKRLAYPTHSPKTANEWGTRQEPERQYSPAQCISAVAAVVNGRPDPRYISTSYVERTNLTMRMSMRRFTRLTNAFSKKVDNLRHAVSLYCVHYNVCRIHQTLRVTPAMEAKLTTKLWTVADIVRMLPVNQVAAT